MTTPEEFRLIIHRVPDKIRFELSFDQLKVFHRWLYAGAHTKPSGLSNVLFIMLLTKAYLKVNGIIAFQKPKNKFSLPAEQALAFHNMIKSSPHSDDVYEYTVISNIFLTIDQTFINSL